MTISRKAKPMTPSPEDRHEYLDCASEALEVKALVVEFRKRLAASIKRFGDPLGLQAMLDEALYISPPEVTPKGRSQPKRPFKRRSFTAKPMPEIAFGLVEANPGRTLHQLKSALAGLPDGLRFHADSLSPVLTDLVKEGKVIRALCDTERGLKYYARGAVPPGQLVFSASAKVGNISGAERRTMARPPTPAEMSQSKPGVRPDVTPIQSRRPA